MGLSAWQARAARPRSAGPQFQEVRSASGDGSIKSQPPGLRDSPTEHLYVFRYRAMCSKRQTTPAESADSAGVRTSRGQIL